MRVGQDSRLRRDIRTVIDTILSFLFGPWPFLAAGILMNTMAVKSEEADLAKMGLFFIGLAAVLWNLQH